MKTRIASLAVISLLVGCSLGQSGPTPATYDYGRMPAHVDAQPRAGSVNFLGVTSTPWLDSPAISYRLMYVHAARRASYRDSQWIAPPAALLTTRMRAGLAQAKDSVQDTAVNTRTPQYSLRVELEEFIQVFDTANSSHVEVRAIGYLRDGSSAQTVDRAFAVKKPAPTPDASGAVRGLTEASDALILEVREWINAVLRTRNGGT